MAAEHIWLASQCVSAYSDYVYCVVYVFVCLFVCPTSLTMPAERYVCRFSLFALLSFL